MTKHNLSTLMPVSPDTVLSPERTRALIRTFGVPFSIWAEDGTLNFPTWQHFTEAVTIWTWTK